MTDLERELRRAVEGDVRFDPYSRLLYSTDASMYQMEPIGVVIPRHAGDVQAVLELANRENVAVLPRGGGTSLTGQTVNRAVVLDFSRWMQGVLEVNREEMWARVQPGVVQDELNAHVRPLGLLFGPDTSTSNRATIGGMLGNNSGGSHSIAYGLTVEHVIEITALLAEALAAPGRLEHRIAHERDRVLPRVIISLAFPDAVRRVHAHLARPRFENEPIVIEILGDVLPPEDITQKRPRCVSIVGVNQRMN